MKLFVSYRRKSWPFTSQLASSLRKRIDAEVFVDYQSVDETDFEKSILRHLRESDVVLLIVSEYTFASSRIQHEDDWVRREIREALRLKKPIVAIFIDSQTFPNDLPADIRDVRRMQGVFFYPEYFEAGVKRLVDFMLAAALLKPSQLDTFDDETEEVPMLRPTLPDAAQALDDGDFEKAIFLLEELRRTGYSSQFISLDEIIKVVSRQRDREQRWQEAFHAYKDIAALARNKITLDEARAAWNAFQSAYPEFTDDLDNLAEKLASPAPRQIEEIIVSGSDRSADDLSLDDVLSYFASPVDSDEDTQPQTPPRKKKGASSGSARST